MLRRVLVLSVNDVAPHAHDATQVWWDALRERGVAATFFVTPDPSVGPPLGVDHSLVSMLSDAASSGSEIALALQARAIARPAAALHSTAVSVPLGLNLKSFITQPARASGLRGASENGASELHWAAKRGRMQLVELGFAPIGVTSPHWQLPSALSLLLHGDGFQYATSHSGLYALDGSARIALTPFAYRPGAPRGPVAYNAFTELVEFASAADMPVRFALFPDDARDQDCRNARLNALDAFLDLGFQPTVYQSLLRVVH